MVGIKYKEKKIVISDDTLRDGEQQVGIVFWPEEKIDLANLSSDVGVNYINIMPIVSKEEYDATAELLSMGIHITPITMMGSKYVDQSIKTGAKDITIFTATSDILMNTREENREEKITKTLDVLKYAYSKNLEIDFAIEDATRTDFNYLTRFIKKIKQYIRTLYICDTVGCMQPPGMSLLIKNLRRVYKGQIGVHCHNDLNKAVDNTIAAIDAGAEAISGTFTGIGERAGNANLGEILRFFRDERRIIIPNINYDKIEILEKRVRKYAGKGPAKPLTKPAFYTETGIHVHSMLKNHEAYSIFPDKKHIIFFGKYSGISNFYWIFSELIEKGIYTGDMPSEEKLKIMRDDIKKLAIEEKKSFSYNDILNLYIINYRRKPTQALKKQREKEAHN